ncbi:MAG TPA: hypothetical protein DCZ75_06030 [Geobacter sp.]|nr:hypothetical protein [Geobacter sp.]
MKTINAVALFLALSVAGALPAFGADPSWVQVDTDENSAFYYDKNATTKPRQDVVRVIARAVYTESGKADALKTLGGGKGLETLYESRYVYDIDCVQRQGRLLAATHMDKNGGILKSSDLGPYTDWEYLPLVTRMGLVADTACRE